MSDPLALAGSSKLAQMLGGYLPPRKKFELDVLRCDASGAPITIRLRMAASFRSRPGWVRPVARERSTRAREGA